MINFIKSSTPDEGIPKLAELISTNLNAGRRVLWLIAGGSNVPIAVRVMRAMREITDPMRLVHLTVSQTDERYGPLGHHDSNWAQMKTAGFDFHLIKNLPILRGMPVEQTVKLWAPEIEQAFATSEVKIAQFGMGADGHIAGLLPHSPAIAETGSVAWHRDDKFTRISLTPEYLRKIDEAYAFVYGSLKTTAVHNLRDHNASLTDEPAQILKEIPQVSFYSDCL